MKLVEFTAIKKSHGVYTALDGSREFHTPTYCKYIESIDELTVEEQEDILDQNIVMKNILKKMSELL